MPTFVIHVREIDIRIRKFTETFSFPNIIMKIISKR